MDAPADAARELVQLGEAEALGAFYHDRARVRHVHADLDDYRGDEDLDLPGPKRAMTSRLSRAFIRPCRRPTRLSGKISAASSSCSSSAALTSSSASDSSTSGQMTYACRPSSSSRLTSSWAS